MPTLMKTDKKTPLYETESREIIGSAMANSKRVHHRESPASMS